MLQGELTDDQKATLIAKLDEVAMQFLERTMVPERTALYLRTMIKYSGYSFSYGELLETFDLACERFTKMPSAKEIIDTNNPNIS